MAGGERFIGITVALMTALGVSACSQDDPPPGVSSDFWDVHDSPDSSAHPGDMHAVQERDDAPPGAQGWNMIYVSEIEQGTNAFVSGEVYMPEEPSDAPRDIVLWNHPTTGLPDECAPSRNEVSDTRIPELRQLLENGHIVVTSDYPGQGLPGPAYYMVGDTNARASLDALKAVEQLPDVETTGDFVQYGFSQGGQTAMHAEAIAAEYAPDFELRGTSLISAATRVQGLTTNAMQDKRLTGFAMSMLTGMRAAHPYLEFDDFLTEEALEVLPEVDDGCWDIWNSATAIDEPYTNTAMQDGEDWTAAMAEIDNFTPTGSSPFIVHHGDADAIAPVEVARREVATLCEAGSSVEYHEFEGLEHGSVVAEAAEVFPDWAQARFNGEPATDHC